MVIFLAICLFLAFIYLVPREDGFLQVIQIGIFLFLTTYFLERAQQ